MLGTSVLALLAAHSVRANAPLSVYLLQQPSPTEDGVGVLPRGFSGCEGCCYLTLLKFRVAKNLLTGSEQLVYPFLLFVAHVGPSCMVSDV